MTSSMSPLTRSRVASSCSSTACGVKKALISRLYSRCSGGSTISGMAGIGDGPPGMVMPSSELKLSQSCATRTTSACLVTIQKPPCSLLCATGQCSRIWASVGWS